MKTPSRVALFYQIVSPASALLLAATLSAQTPAPAPATAASTGATPPKGLVVEKIAPKSDDSDVIQMDVFEVSSENNKGYLATSAMSGTRLNSKIEDIAASITVVTKQQLMDTASVDINDVFLYESNTEGTKQWTSFANDRGTISDDIQANPTSATRMRGLSAANTAVGGFVSSLPFDSYNVDSVEISRGPNSSVFGMGNTGGGINVNNSKANLTREVTSFGTRRDSYGGYRASFDFNRPILKNKVAIRVLGLYDSKGFELQPASEKIRRLTTALTVRPFKNTTIRASFESYRDYYNRPNSTTPRDGVSDWISSGQPTYDPITATVHFANGKPSIGPITTANENAQLPGTISPSDSTFTGTQSLYIDHGQIQLFEINDMPAATGTGPTSVNTAAAHLLQSTTYFGRYATANPLSLTQGINNKALYDWSSINIGAPNYGKMKGETSIVDFEQVIVNTPRSLLAFQASWMQERTATTNRSFLGSYGNNGGKFQVYVDVNEKLLDGSVNPYFLRPYLGYSSPRYGRNRNANNNYRSTLAYELNMTNEKGGLKWLGRNRLTGYGEYHSTYTFGPTYSDTIGNDQPWMSATGVPANRTGNSYKVYMHYLVGDANGFNVDYGPPGIVAPPLTIPLRYYNAVSGQWINENENIVEYYGANRPNRRVLSTYGGTWQGFFLNERIVPTFGIRQDLNRTKDANSATASAASDGYYVGPVPEAWTAYDWVKNEGTTKTSGVVVKALPWLHLLYNRSTSFSPGALNYDVLGQPLPDPRGRTRDYGVELVLFNDRLRIRAQQYETLDIGRADSTINTYVQRTLRMDGGPNAPVYPPVVSGDPNLTAWYANELYQLHPAWTLDQINAEVIKQTGVDPTFIAGHYGKVHGDRSNASSRGKEVEITFNPNKFWTIKSTITQAKPFNALLSQELQDYIFNQRMQTWTTIKGPYTGNTWWTSPLSSGSSSPQAFYTANVLAPLKVAVATQGKPKTQSREWRYNIVTHYQLAGITQNRWLKNMDVGGAFRWEDKASIGYYGAAPDADGIVRNLDRNRPIWDKSRYYIDLSAGYNLRLFTNKVRARIQLNVRNIFENGHLQAVAFNPDGSPYAFRIIDPRQFILSVNFDL